MNPIGCTLPHLKLKLLTFIYAQISKKRPEPLVRAEFRKTAIRMTPLEPLVRAEFRKTAIRMTPLKTLLKPLVRAEFRKTVTIYIRLIT